MTKCRSKKLLDHYIITIPAQMQHSSSDRACVTFMSMTRSLKIRLELQRGDRVHVLAEDMMDILNYSRCFLFRVPAVEEKEQVWSFHALVQGDDINFNQSKKVVITNGNQVMFIQTDKPLYKPGQTVRFRVATLDKTLRASNDTYPVVELLDPQRNRIAQWRNVSPINGIADFTFPLAEELTLGEYKISIPNRLEKTFSVSEYISKRFEVLINVPSMVTDKDKSLTIDACGRYSYGKPVMGALNITICPRKVYAWTYFIYEDEETPPEGCQVLPVIQTETNGCVSKAIDFDFSNTGNTYFYTKLEIFCTLTEHNTGQMEKAFAVISIENRRQTIRFVEIGNYYQKGVPFTGMIKVEDKRGEPQQDEVVFLEVINDDTKSNVSLRTDRLGIVRFTLNTSEWNDTVLVTGKFSLDEVDEEDEEDSLPYKWLSPFYSESKSFLKVESIADTLECDSEQRIRVDYYLNKNHLDPQAEHLSFFYMILAKGGIIHHGEHKVNLHAATHPSSFYLEIPVTSDLFPEASLLVFTVLMNGEMVAGLGKYALAKCLKSKVELEFSEKKVRPGRKVNLEIKAESGSLCSVRSVDKGVLLHQSHTGTSKSSILDGIKEWIINTGVYDFPNIPEDFEEYRCLEKEALEQTQRQHPWYHGTSDVYSLFKESGLKVFTNTKIKQPVTCLAPEFTLRSFDGVVQLSSKPKASRVSNSNENSEKVRTFFPDTWLYDLVPIGPKGLAILNVTAPDSITSWVTDAFCLWKSGFGETNAVSLTTFKPYFIDLMLPYSIIQGEELTLTAIVFSYVKQCMMAVVWLSDSPDFTVIQGSRKQYACICADQMASFTWNITTVKIGVVKLSVRSSAARQEGGCTERDFNQRKKLRSDALMKSVIVKPSGILQEAAETFFLCPSGSSVQEDVSLHVPDDVVQGSEHAHVSVHGDIMGKATENLGHLLRLPHGCGEQNIAIFAPNIYIMQYLESTKQLTPALKRRALKYLTTGRRDTM
uniref:Alpha-2-macroglobulin bait region domain-containing protein n=1 Tax=Leptobrachium leishanense TaxID=445787 RepID=A0A8C5QD14_9ANUR